MPLFEHVLRMSSIPAHYAFYLLHHLSYVWRALIYPFFLCAFLFRPLFGVLVSISKSFPQAED